MKNNAIYWFASLSVAFVNYLYYPVLGRLMKPVDFGETQTVISIFTQAAIFFQVLSLLGIGIISKYQDEVQRNKITNELSRFALLLSLIVLVCMIVFSAQLKGFFHFTSVYPFMVLACSLLVSVPLSFANSYLQGHSSFWKLSIGSFLGALSKLLFAVVLVILGFKVIGAVGGLVLAQILVLVYALKMGKGIRNFVSSNLHLHRPQLSLIKPELPFAGMVFATSLTTNLMLSFDILVVKHYFPPREAGFYTGISIISNIIFYVTGSISGVLIPSIKLSNTAQENSRLLRRSLLLLFPIGGVVTLVFILVPSLIVDILLGHRYVAYAMYLKGLSLALFIMSISNLLIYYHIGLRHYLVTPVVIVSLCFTLGLLQHSHATMGLVVHDLVFGATALLVLLVGMSLRYRQEIT
jgi:O-antigen/teichoic acid export membrane protein